MQRIFIKHNHSINHEGKRTHKEDKHGEQVINCRSHSFDDNKKILTVTDLGGNQHLIHGVSEINVI